MAIQTDQLIDQLKKAGIQAAEGEYFRFDLKDLKSSVFYSEAMSIYRNLGGLLNVPPVIDIRPFMLLDDNMFFEIDDALQFNRYRMTTLRSGVYPLLKGVNAEQYKRFCRMYEKECLKPGLVPGRWTSAESEVHFGPSADPGDFFGNGSPGWKLVAYHSFLEDLFAATHHRQIIRTSIYDQVFTKGRVLRIKELISGNGGYGTLIRTIAAKITAIKQG